MFNFEIINLLILTWFKKNFIVKFIEAKASLKKGQNIHIFYIQLTFRSLFVHDIYCINFTKVEVFVYLLWVDQFAWFVWIDLFYISACIIELNKRIFRQLNRSLHPWRCILIAHSSALAHCSTAHPFLINTYIPKFTSTWSLHWICSERIYLRTVKGLAWTEEE